MMFIYLCWPLEGAPSSYYISPQGQDTPPTNLMCSKLENILFQHSEGKDKCVPSPYGNCLLLRTEYDMTCLPAPGMSRPQPFLPLSLTPLSCLALTRADHCHLKGWEHSCWHMTFTVAASAPPPPSSQRTLAQRGGEAAPICTQEPISKDWGIVIWAHLHPILGATSAGNLGSKRPEPDWSFPHCQITTSPVHMTLKK